MLRVELFKKNTSLLNFIENLCDFASTIDYSFNLEKLVIDSIDCSPIDSKHDYIVKKFKSDIENENINDFYYLTVKFMNMWPGIEKYISDYTVTEDSDNVIISYNLI